MSKFELRVTVRNNGSVEAKRTDTEAQQDGEVKLDDLTRDTINIFENWLNKQKLSERREFEVLGAYLYQALFNGVEQFFENQLAEARKSEQRLVLQLSFQGNDELASLPWEYLYSRHLGFFLATHVDLVISRYISLEQGYQPREAEKSPLRVLIVVSSPEDEDLVPVVGAEQLIQDVQGLSDKDDLRIETHVLSKPTLNNFFEKLNECKPHVLHFIGYSRLKKDEKEAAEIALLDDDDEKSVRWVRDVDFIDYWIYGSKTWIPPLILLHLCESASAMKSGSTMKNASAMNFDTTHLASKLLQAGFPSVVAMRHPITNKAARYFSKAFYRSLARGLSIDAAVQDGRAQIVKFIPNAYDDRVFGTPVLYMRSYGGIIQLADEPAVERNSLTSQNISRNPIPTAPAPTVKQNIASEAEYKLDTVSDQKSKIETRKSEAQVNTPSSGNTTTLLFETIISAGEKTIKGISSLDEKSQVQMLSQLYEMCEKLRGKQYFEIISFLLKQKNTLELNHPLREVIQSILDRVLGEER